MTLGWITEVAVGAIACSLGHAGLKDGYELSQWRWWVYRAPFLVAFWAALDLYKRLP